MQAAKPAILDVVENLPEQATFDGVLYVIYVRQKQGRSRQAAGEG